MSNSQTPSRVARMVRAKRFSSESTAASAVFRWVTSTKDPVMRVTLPSRSCSTVAVSAIQRMAPSGSSTRYSQWDEGWSRVAAKGVLRMSSTSSGCKVSSRPVEVFGGLGGQPFVAREKGPVVRESHQFKKQRSAGDLAGDEIQIEHAEAAGGLREFQELGGSAQLRVAATAVDFGGR